MAMLDPFFVIRIICIRDPVSRLFDIPPAVFTVDGILKAFHSITHEIDGDQRLRTYASAEIMEFKASDAIGLYSPPIIIVHGGAFIRGADAFPPFVITDKAAAPTDHIRCQILDSRYQILAPIVFAVIPGRIDRSVRYAQRLHKLHIHVGRDLKTGCGINDDYPFSCCSAGRI